MKNKIAITLFFLFCGNVFGQGVWTQKANFGGGYRYCAIGFSINGKGYIGTGSDNIGQLRNDLWEYNPTNNSWTQKANFNGLGVMNTVGFSIGNKGYVGTGYTNVFVNGSPDTKNFWEYDPTLNVWTQKNDYPGFAVNYAVGFSVGLKGYIGSGNANGAPMHDLWEYNPTTDSWLQKANLYWGGVIRPTCFSIVSKGYVVTGGLLNSNLKDLWEYDTLTNGWTQKASYVGAGGYYTTGFSLGNFGFVGTGSDTNAITHNDFWQYDPTLNNWTQISNIPSGRNYSVGFSIGSKGYVGTGYSTGMLQDFWEYAPSLTSANDGSTSLTMTISIFPNPFSSQTNLHSDKELNNATLTIYNLAGEKIKTINKISGTEIKIERENMNAGIYFYELVIDSNILSSGKMIIVDH